MSSSSSLTALVARRLSAFAGFLVINRRRHPSSRSCSAAAFGSPSAKGFDDSRVALLETTRHPSLASRPHTSRQRPEHENNAVAKLDRACTTALDKTRSTEERYNG